MSDSVTLSIAPADLETVEAPKLTAQQRFSLNLRNLADYYDANPDVPSPTGKLKFSIMFEPKDYRILPTDAVTEITEGTTKGFAGLFYRKVIREEFELSFYCGVARICEKKVTGIVTATTEVLEWVIKDGILPAAPVASSDLTDDDIPF
jgi:hypothetical protein